MALARLHSEDAGCCEAALWALRNLSTDNGACLQGLIDALPLGAGEGGWGATCLWHCRLQKIMPGARMCWWQRTHCCSCAHVSVPEQSPPFPHAPPPNRPPDTNMKAVVVESGIEFAQVQLQRASSTEEMRRAAAEILTSTGNGA